MSKVVKSGITLLVTLFLISNIAFAGGLSTRFVVVKLKKLEPGKTYNITKETGKKLIVKNTTESMTVNIGMKPEKPVDYNLVTGYESVPDLSWVTIKKDYFEKIGPGQSAETDVLISIPTGDEHYGRKYQVYIYSYTAGKETLRMGLMSRILIETIKAPGKEETLTTPPEPIS